MARYDYGLGSTATSGRVVSKNEHETPRWIMAVNCNPWPLVSGQLMSGGVAPSIGNKKITWWLGMTNALLEEMAPTARNSHYTRYFKAWSPITFLFHYRLRDINAFHSPIRPHFTLKKWNVGRGGKDLRHLLHLLFFCRNGPTFWFFLVFQGLVPNDLPTSLLFAWNQRISVTHQAPLHLKKVEWGDGEGLAPSIPPCFLAQVLPLPPSPFFWGEVGLDGSEMSWFHTNGDEVGTSLGTKSWNTKKIKSDHFYKKEVQWPPYFITFAWNQRISVTHQAPLHLKKSGVGGGGKDLRHLFHLFFA